MTAGAAPAPVNVFDVELGPPTRPAPPGYGPRSARLGPLVGAAGLGGTVYELQPGMAICPYHWEGVEEEWLVVLTGTVTLRDPDGEHALVAGDVVAFPRGPEGAHKVTNSGADVSRVLMLSTTPEHEISICVYPDSGKVGVWPPGHMFRIADAVDYWDGEA